MLQIYAWMKLLFPVMLSPLCYWMRRLSRIGSSGSLKILQQNFNRYVSLNSSWGSLRTMIFVYTMCIGCSLTVLSDYLNVGEMEKSLGLLHKYSAYLASLSSILEVLESSFKGRPLAQLHDLHHLQESILKTKQV